MITADQLLLHAIGDYILQSDWMANEKTKASFPAWCHALTYSLPFLLLTMPTNQWGAWQVIFWTHFFIDRFRLARYVVWVNPADRPAWLTVWLLIIVDNVIHITINGLALRYL